MQQRIVFTTLKNILIEAILCAERTRCRVDMKLPGPLSA
jgi:hypothetical protein